MRVRRPIKNIRIISIKAALKLNYGGTARRQLDCVIVPVRFACGKPAGNLLVILHIIQHMTYKLPLLVHRGRKLSSHFLYSPTENSQLIELILG
jgi:hypothetical protein